jgi:hypothetical protein
VARVVVVVAVVAVVAVVVAMVAAAVVVAAVRVCELSWTTRPRETHGDASHGRCFALRVIL